MRLFFFLLIFSSPTFGITLNSLTLYVLPSPHGIDWSSPKGLALSGLKNRFTFKKRFLGHIFVELSCEGKNELTSMAPVKYDYLNQLLFQERGLGILFHSFEGTLEDEGPLRRELAELLKDADITFTRFLLNSGQCKRITRYLHEYREKNVGRYYGLPHRPRFGEGAGGTTFGVSFLDVLNLLDQEMRESWSETVKIPLELAGPPLQDKGVSLLKVMLNSNFWARDSEEHRLLSVWDPDRIKAWIQKRISSPRDESRVFRIENSKGIIFDKKHVPAPEGPIWLQLLDPENPGKTK